MKRKRLDVRTVRSLLRHDDVPFLLGESGGFDLRWIAPEERPALWDEIRPSYVGTHRPNRTRGPFEYQGHEFTNDDGARLLYVEVWC